MSTPWHDHLKSLAYVALFADDPTDAAAADRLIADLQLLAGQPLPADYLDFLRTFPASGTFDVNGTIAHPSAHDGDFTLTNLLAGSKHANCDARSLRREQVSHRGQMLPLDWLAIGEDLGGNRFAIDLRRETAGQVAFWNHETNRLTPLAPGFERFVLGLRLDAW